MGKVKQPGGMLQAFLQELLRKLASFEEGWLTLQHKVANDLVFSEDPFIQRIRKRFGDSKFFRIVREFWHPRFRKHLDLEPPQESVLCAFGEVVDNVINQAGLTTFLGWVCQQPSFNQQACQAALSNPASLKRVKDLSEAVAAIAHSLPNPPALKPIVASAQLREDLRQGVNELMASGYREMYLGGAAAIISDVLSQLGLERVHLYSMYHSDVVAGLYRGQPQRLDLNLDPPQLICVNQPGQYSFGGVLYPHPTRNSDIFTYRRNFSITIGNQIFTAKQDDRIVFRIYRYIGDHTTQWRQVKIRFLQQGGLTPWLQGPSVEDDEWPAPRGFLRWRVNNDALELEYLDGPGIQEIRNYDYIILNAPGLATFWPITNALEYMEAQSLRQQLKWLSEGPAKIHLEISGGADPHRDRIGPFIQNMKGLIHSAGINDGELLEIASLPDYQPPVTVTAAATAIYQRYELALRLATELGLERLYVHGNDVDLILRKGGSPGDMRAEIEADLFAKGIVVLAVLQRTIDDWHGYLQADCAIAVARDMIDRAQENLSKMTQEGALSKECKKEVDNAKGLLTTAEEDFRNKHFASAEEKAKKAQRLVGEIFGIPSEPSERAAVSLSPLLLTKSFKTLIEFAYDYVRFALGENAPSSLSGLTEKGEEIFQRIVETGYHVTLDPEGYSVAVVPVMWPELPIELNPTGAGDICSGVTLVYSGF
jgi:ADP-dependent phosphofructokinase/glucokinase